MSLKFNKFFVITCLLIGHVHSQDIKNSIPAIGDRVSGVVSLEQEKQIGTQFLKHLSRTNILLHVLDIQNFSSEGKINDLTSINNELEKFDVKLANKRQYLIFNKVDLLDTRELEEKKKYILNYYDEKEVFFTSAVGNIGIEDLKKKIFYEITKNS